MSLRRQIDQWVGHALDYGHQEAREEAVATILSRFRDALLSDEAVTAMLSSQFSPEVLGDDRYKLTTPERALTAVADAIIDLEPEP